MRILFIYNGERLWDRKCFIQLGRSPVQTNELTLLLHTSNLCKIWITKFALTLKIVLFGKKIQNLVNCNLKIFDYANSFSIHGFFLQLLFITKLTHFDLLFSILIKCLLKLIFMTFFFILIISHVIVVIHHMLTKIMLIM